MNYNIFKINRLWAFIMPIALLVFAIGCKDEKADYINLSLNSFTFSPNGSEEVTISVDASQSWSVDYENKWVVEKGKNSNSIVLSAMPTQSGVDRTAKLIFRAGEAMEIVYLSQLGTNVNYILLEPNSAVTVISPNGKYIGGVASSIVNTVYEFTPFIINVATGTRTEKPKLTDAHTPSCISDNGDLILLEEAKMTSKYYDNNALVALKIPEGMRNPNVSANSSDGKILVGFAQRIEDRRYYPIKWVDKEPEIMEVVEKDLLDVPVDIGIYARGCSADGSIIYGAIADDQTALYWKDGKINFLGKDKIKVHSITINHTGQDVSFLVSDRPVFYADKTSMSPDGKYLATTFSEVSAPNKYEVTTYYPAYFDFDKEVLTIIRDLPAGFDNGSGSTISNDGILTFGCPAIGYTDAFVYDINSKIIQSVPTFVKEEYGVTVGKSTLITRMTNESKTLFGLSIILFGVSYQYWYLDIAE